MPAPVLTWRPVLALLLLALTALICVSLGRWQLDRAAQRIAIAQAIQQGRQAPPLALTAAADASALQEWRPASATGTWLPDYTVLLDNRNLDGRPGVWVATPMRLQHSPDTALLVLRGWLPRQIGATPPATPPKPAAGIHTLTGQLRTHVPRLFELWQRSGRNTSALPATWPAATPPVVQNLDLDDYAHATGLKLLPVVLEQTQAVPSDPDSLVRTWETPSLDADKNKGYALQWFGFATIAAIAIVIILSRLLHTYRQQRKGANPTPH